MAQIPLGSKWSRLLKSLNEQDESRDEKDDSNVLKITKEIDRDSSTSASANMSMSYFGSSFKWFDELFGISPTTK